MVPKNAVYLYNISFAQVTYILCTSYALQAGIFIVKSGSYGVLPIAIIPLRKV
jgi:hypothetical protein